MTRQEMKCLALCVTVGPLAALADMDVVAADLTRRDCCGGTISKWGAISRLGNDL